MPLNCRPGMSVRPSLLRSATYMLGGEGTGLGLGLGPGVAEGSWPL